MTGLLMRQVVTNSSKALQRSFILTHLQHNLHQEILVDVFFKLSKTFLNVFQTPWREPGFDGLADAGGGSALGINGAGGGSVGEEEGEEEGEDVVPAQSVLSTPASSTYELRSTSYMSEVERQQCTFTTNFIVFYSRLQSDLITN